MKNPSTRVGSANNRLWRKKRMYTFQFCVGKKEFGWERSTSYLTRGRRLSNHSAINPLWNLLGAVIKIIYPKKIMIFKDKIRFNVALEQI